MKKKECKFNIFFKYNHNSKLVLRSLKKLNFINNIKRVKIKIIIK